MKTLTVTSNRIFDGLARKTRRIIPVHYTDNNLLSVDTVVVKFEEATRLGCGVQSIATMINTGFGAVNCFTGSA